MFPSMSVLSDRDYQRLQELRAPAGVEHRRVAAESQQEHLASLRLVVVAVSEVPPDVVTIHSCVRLEDVKSRKTWDVQLVLPGRLAEGDANPLEVTSELGLAILGRRVGEEIECDTPTGVQWLRIREILFQPETAGVPDP